jgi:hypothetical protein
LKKQNSKSQIPNWFPEVYGQLQGLEFGIFDFGILFLSSSTRIKNETEELCDGRRRRQLPADL